MSHWLTESLWLWAKWEIRELEEIGYSHENILNILRIEGVVIRSPTGTKVLCLDTPRNVRKIQVEVRKLRKIYKDALYAKYVVISDEQGRPTTNSYLAHKLGITTYNFEKRVYRARDMLANAL